MTTLGRVYYVEGGTAGMLKGGGAFWSPLTAQVKDEEGYGSTPHARN